MRYIRIFDYWMINKTPIEFYKYIIKNKDKINMNLLNDLFTMNDLINEIKSIIETPDRCYYFVLIGHLECLKYAHENGFEWLAEEICNIAAKNGHLKCLKYAHKYECDWDKQTCEFAADNGHLECLKYIRENPTKI